MPTPLEKINERTELLTRTTGKPVRGTHLHDPSPPTPPADPPEGDGDNHGEHRHEYEMLCIATAIGWVARFKSHDLKTEPELPVIAWVLIDETCSAAPPNAQPGQFTEGLCILPGATEGPRPATWFAGKDKEKREFGEFIGYFPA